MLPGKKGSSSRIYPSDIPHIAGGADRGEWADQAAALPGAKRNGFTDHLSGIHRIPTVGREAMVPGEVVRRQKPKPRPKPKEHDPIAAMKEWKTMQKRQASLRKERKDDQRDSGDRRRRRDSSSSSEDQGSLRKKEDDNLRRHSPIKTPGKEEERSEDEEEDPRKAAEAAKALKRIEDARAAAFEAEQKKLTELDQIRKQKEEVQRKRKSNLGGLFALTEDEIADDEDEQSRKQRLDKERAQFQKKAANRAKADKPEWSNPLAPMGNNPGSSSRVELQLQQQRLVDAGAAAHLTASDLDGKLHEHKFSKVWKDWDATKKSDPGAIADQFMKIAAIKRRGYSGGEHGTGGKGDRGRSPPRGARRGYSRSRSRTRRR